MASLISGKTDFELPATDGGIHSLTQALSRGPLLVTFFKVSCPTCQFTVPFIERLYQQIREYGGQVWGISQDDREDSLNFAERLRLSFPILIDAKPYAASKQYRLKFVPALFLFAPDGTVRVSCDGFSKPDLLEIHKYFAASLAFNPPPFFGPEEKIPQYKPG